MNINLKQIDFIIIHSIFKIMESLLLPITPSIFQTPRKCLRDAGIHFEDSIFWEILLLIKKDDYARELLRFGRQMRRFISPLHFHKRGPWLRRIRAEMQQEILQHFRDVWSSILKSRCRHVVALWDFPQRNSSLYEAEMWLKLQWIINSINYSYTMITRRR